MGLDELIIGCVVAVAGIVTWLFRERYAAYLLRWHPEGKRPMSRRTTVGLVAIGWTAFGVAMILVGLLQ